MKGLKRNKRPFYYALYKGTTYTDKNGKYTGEPRILYETPVKTAGNVSPARGAAQAEIFGVNESFDRVICMDDPNCPINLHTALVLDGEPQFDGDDLIYDHIVKNEARGLDNVLYAVQRVDHRQDELENDETDD